MTDFDVYAMMFEDGRDHLEFIDMDGNCYQPTPDQSISYSEQPSEFRGVPQIGYLVLKDYDSTPQWKEIVKTRRPKLFLSNQTYIFNLMTKTVRRMSMLKLMLRVMGTEFGRTLVAK